MESSLNEKVPRTTSEIIVDLENKIDLMIKIIVSNDTNTKLLLDRLNKICSLLENINNKFPSVTKNIGDENISLNSLKEEITEAQFPIEVETNPKGMRRTARQETYTGNLDNVKLTPVQQKVFDINGKSVFMAEVEIFNSENILVSKIKTTAAGKWQLPLPEGNFTVNILKKENGNRKKMEYNGTFQVKNSDVPITLEPAKLQ